MSAESDDLVLTGQTENHLADLPGKMRVHRAVLAPFERLKKKASNAGFDLEVVSAFRGFSSQLAIWNQKAQGKRPLLDLKGAALDSTRMTPRQIADAILVWSALPGASRHHWGTDLDVIDRLSVPPRYTIQLTPSEVERGGIFSQLHDWLDRHMAEEGFFRPYQKDLGGVQPERWHISYAPVAQKLFESHGVEVLKQALQAADLELKEVVLPRVEEIFERYFLRISPP